MGLACGDPRVVLVKHSQNRGVGGAMLSGYAKAVELGATIMVKMDGDGQMAPEFLPDIVRPILQGKADYTKGNRFVLIRIPVEHARHPPVWQPGAVLHDENCQRLLEHL